MKSPNIGELDRRINLYTYTQTQSQTGEPVRSWTLLAAVWALVEYSGGSENIIADTPTATADIFFTIRYRSSITEKIRVEYHGVSYNVTHIEEIDRKRYLKLSASKPDNQ